MEIKNVKVALSYTIAGAQLLRGEYKYVERTNNGNLLPEEQRLRIISLPVISDCKKNITLDESFINHAISNDSLDERSDPYFIIKKWKKMNSTERLHYHIQKYVSDMGGLKFEYSII